MQCNVCCHSIVFVVVTIVSVLVSHGSHVHSILCVNAFISQFIFFVHYFQRFGAVGWTTLTFEVCWSGIFLTVSSVKLLGLHLDANVSWRSHVEAMLSKATQRLYFLKLLKRAGVPSAQLQHFCCSNSANSRVCGPSLASSTHELPDRPDRSRTETSGQYYIQFYLWHAILQRRFHCRSHKPPSTQTTTHATFLSLLLN